MDLAQVPVEDAQALALSRILRRGSCSGSTWMLRHESRDMDVVEDPRIL